jgi:MFS family permease
VYIERNARAPLVDLTLFRSRPFRSGIVSGALSYIVLFGVLFVSPLHLEALGITPLQAGFIVTVLPLALGAVAPFASTLARAFGTLRAASMGILIAGAGVFAAGEAGANIATFTGALAAIGAGLGVFVPLNNAAVAGEGATAQAGMVSGILNMTRGIGTALGVAVAAAVFTRAGFGIVAFALAVVGLAAAIVTGAARPNRPAAGGV